MAGRGAIREIVITVGVALVLAWFVQGYVVKPYRIPSESMENTLKCQDRVLVNRMSYRFGSPHRQDVVVFHPPARVASEGTADRSKVDGRGGEVVLSGPWRKREAAKTNYIKRLIGMPGDTVEVRNQHAYINGKKLDEPYLRPIAGNGPAGGLENWGPHKVPRGAYLMLGDNRDHSADGRVFGWVPRSSVIGPAFMIYWPPKHVGKLPAKDAGGAASRAPDPNCLESVPGQS